MTKKATEDQSVLVAIPIAGALHIEVPLLRGETEEDAFRKAWARYHKDAWDAGEVEWEAHNAITNGNVCHASHHEISVAGRIK